MALVVLPIDERDADEFTSDDEQGGNHTIIHSVYVGAPLLDGERNGFGRVLQLSEAAANRLRAFQVENPNGSFERAISMSAGVHADKPHTMLCNRCVVSVVEGNWSNGQMVGLCKEFEWDWEPDVDSTCEEAKVDCNTHGVSTPDAKSKPQSLGGKVKCTGNMDFQAHTTESGAVSAVEPAAEVALEGSGVLTVRYRELQRGQNDPVAAENGAKFHYTVSVAGGWVDYRLQRHSLDAWSTCAEGYSCHNRVCHHINVDSRLCGIESQVFCVESDDSESDNVELAEDSCGDSDGAGDNDNDSKDDSGSDSDSAEMHTDEHPAFDEPFTSDNPPPSSNWQEQFRAGNLTFWYPPIARAVTVTGQKRPRSDNPVPQSPNATTPTPDAGVSTPSSGDGDSLGPDYREVRCFLKGEWGAEGVMQAARAGMVYVNGQDELEDTTECGPGTKFVSYSSDEKHRVTELKTPVDDLYACSLPSALAVFRARICDGASPPFPSSRDAYICKVQQQGAVRVQYPVCVRNRFPDAAGAVCDDECNCVYRYDPGTEDCLSSDPTLPDLYEQTLICVRKARVYEATDTPLDHGEGVFLRSRVHVTSDCGNIAFHQRPFLTWKGRCKQGEVGPSSGKGKVVHVDGNDCTHGGLVVSFYNGRRVRSEDVNKRVGWDLCGYSMSVNAECSVDLYPEDRVCSHEGKQPSNPPQNSQASSSTRLDQIRVYAASLGHKVNHSFHFNCRYEPWYHPRFGHIKCIRLLPENFSQSPDFRILRAWQDSELTCDYGYSEMKPCGEWVADVANDLLNDEQACVLCRGTLPSGTCVMCAQCRQSHQTVPDAPVWYLQAWAQKRNSKVDS